MSLLIILLMLRPKPVSRLHPGPKKWILNSFKVNDLPKKISKTLRTSKRISFPRIFLLMCHQVGPNPYRHSSKKTRTVVLTKKVPNNKVKARIFLLLASMPLLSRRTRTKIKTKKTYPTLSATLVSRKIIMPTSVPKKSQKTSVGLDNLHVSDWG